MKSRIPALVLVFLIVCSPSGASGSGSSRTGVSGSAGSSSWTWPLEGHEVNRAFDLPDSPYGAGNRGVDLRGSVGESVRSVAPGIVSYVGTINHVRIVVVDHGIERSTYQPVAASVRVGDAVTAGQPIGTLIAAGSHCPGAACLHLGRKVGEDYLDPLALMASRGQFELISPEGPPPAPPFGSSGSLRRPTGGPVTSPYGMRTHPITHVRKLHDGTDFGVPCGTPVHAAADGVVTKREVSPTYGKRVILKHAGGMSTSYNHLSSRAVSVGQRVAVGQVIGRVGSTGLSTGCHLHFMVTNGGRTINPMKLL